MSKTERCLACGDYFASTSAGDAHRVIAYTYAMVRKVGQGHPVRRIPDGEPIPSGAKVLSRGNQARRCLSGAELSARGMRRNRHGHWVVGADSRWNGASSPRRSESEGLTASGGTSGKGRGSGASESARATA